MCKMFILVSLAIGKGSGGICQIGGNENVQRDTCVANWSLFSHHSPLFCEVIFFNVYDRFLFFQSFLE